LGIIVKFYIISDKASIAVHISNLVNATGNSAMVSENFATWQDQIDDLRKVARDYDFYIIASQSTNKANIEANKIDEIKAFIYVDGESIQDILKESAANTLVISSSLGKQAVTDVVKEFVQVVSGAPPKAAQVKLTPTAKPAEKRQKPKQKKVLVEEEPPKAEVDDKEEDEPEEKDEGPKGKGLISKVKYTFGFD
jgi:hypothetical protein